MSAALLALLLTACGPEPKAPLPIINPHPHEFTKLKITVAPGSGITGVKVDSLWNVGNIGCAPHEGWPSGASIIKQVNTPEKVEQVNIDKWIATIVDDRFLPGKCEWHGGGYWIRFTHGDVVLSSRGTGKSDIEHAGVLKLTCTFNDPHGSTPVCLNRHHEAFFKAHHTQTFNATVEFVK